MVYIKNGEKCYTIEEAMKISDERINKRAKEFVRKFIEKQKQNNDLNLKEKQYV